MNVDAPSPVPPPALEDLRSRLRATRHVALPAGVGWRRGTDAGYLAELVSAWAESYDWREHEERIRAWPWVHTAGAMAGVRSVHQRAADPSAPVVVLLHGWPDSVLRFERLLPLLSDLHVVAPALPGFPFADELTAPGMSVTVMAQAVAGALAELGYDRYVLSAGDVGGDVAEQLAAAHPDRVLAMHLTNLSPRHLRAIAPTTLTADEEDALASARTWQMTEGGYIAEQSTKPHSLAPGLGDSPAGLAAWIVEKLRGWSHCDGDVESVFPRDDLLTWITAYWVTGTIGTSFSSYVEPAAPVTHVDAPVAMSSYAHDIKIGTQTLAERFLNIKVWNTHDAGGHFAAWEQPESYAQGVRDAIALAHAPV